MVKTTDGSFYIGKGAELRNGKPVQLIVILSEIYIFWDKKSIALLTPPFKLLNYCGLQPFHSVNFLKSVIIKMMNIRNSLIFKRESRGEMTKRESYIFWRLAHTLISDYGYRIIQLFENQKELWLEKLENKHAPVIRILLHDFDWGNTMQRDIELTSANGEKIRRQLNRHDLQVVNIYVSENPPVDDYEFRLENPFVYPDGKKTTVYSFLLQRNGTNTGLVGLSNRLQQEIAFPIHEEYSDEDIDSLKKAAFDYEVKRARTEKEILMNSRPLFTYVFMAIQAAVFLWLQMNGGSTNTFTLIKYGAKVNQLMYEGEWWRFITPVFLHIGFLHLAMNTLSLYYLGVAVEQIFGKIRFLFIYLFAGFAGVLASFVFSANLSAGASGAIFGCFGALLYFGAVYPKLFFRTMGMNLIFVLGINLVIGFSISVIDNSAHLGGLAGGFLAAGIVHFPNRRKLLMQLLFLVGAAGIVLGSLSYGFSDRVKGQNEMSAILLVEEYVKQEQFEMAYRRIKEYEESSPNPSENIYYTLSRVEYLMGKFPEAKAHLQTAIELNPTFDRAYFILANLNLEENELNQAKENAEKALKLKPDNPEYADLVRRINLGMSIRGQ